MVYHVHESLFSIGRKITVKDSKNNVVFYAKRNFLLSPFNKRYIRDSKRKVRLIVQNGFWTNVSRSAILFNANKIKIGELNVSYEVKTFGHFEFNTNYIMEDSYNIKISKISKTEIEVSINGEKVGLLRTPLSFISLNSEIEVYNENDLDIVFGVFVMLNNIKSGDSDNE